MAVENRPLDSAEVTGGATDGATFTSVFRRSVALAAVLYFCEMLRAARLFSSDGLFSDDNYTAFLNAQLAINAPMWVAPAVSFLALPCAFLLGFGGAAALLFAGFHRGLQKADKRVPSPACVAFWGAVAAALGVALLHLRNPLLSNSSDVLLGEMLVLAALGAMAKGVRGERFTLLAIGAFGAMVYVGSVFFKLQSAHWWPSLSALGRTLATEDLATKLGLSLGHALPATALRAGSLGVLVVEALAPLVLLAACAVETTLSSRVTPQARSYARRVRMGAAISLLALHAGIIVCMDIGPFPWVCLALWIPFCARRIVRDERDETEKGGEAQGSAGRTWPLGCYLILCAASLAAFIGAPAVVKQGRTHFALYLLHLKQDWRMFSPGPERTITYRAVLTAIDGQTETAIAGGAGGYADKVFWDMFWADVWGAGVSEGLSLALARSHCAPGIESVTLFALSRPLASAVVFVAEDERKPTETVIGRASCPAL